MEKVLLWSFLLLIPTQLGKHWWPEWSYVLGIRVDYLSPTLYLLDVAIAGIFLIQVLKPRRQGWRKIINFKNVLVFCFILGNVLVSKYRAETVYRWLRVGQWVWMLGYLKKNRELVEKYLVKVIPCWVITESLLGLVQVVKGGNIGGVFYWLGERNFRLATTGIAQMTVWGNGIIRAYGTFSHPNSLAGFLLVSLLWWSYQKKQVKRVFWWVVVWLGMLGIGLTASRVVWVVAVLLLVKSLKLKVQSFRKIIGFGLVGLGVMILMAAVVSEDYRVGDFIGGWDKASVTKRAYLNMAALKMIKDNWWLGVGLGNFLVRLPEYQKVNQFFWLQPVHNIFLLIMAEIGILGGLGVAGLIRGVRIKKDYLKVMAVILLTGMMDHYWVSLPQNWWLAGVLLGMGIK